MYIETHYNYYIMISLWDYYVNVGLFQGPDYPCTSVPSGYIIIFFVLCDVIICIYK